MRGTDARTGGPLEGIDHLRQSIRDILTTPLGSRVMRRDYGGRLFELVDRPTDPALLVEIYAATAEALAKWEPRFVLTAVRADTVAAGRVSLTLEGRHRPTGKPLTLEGIIA
ncbi:GPW/gp25 family protein [Geoalkalibacter halelectricus]|uniref:GPW/gp25 family protein n=1 Tax=Geoalkalibacter halelectricus TaxID=2847045 RepID=UPI003D1D17DE